jgi:hypothetical protein
MNGISAAWTLAQPWRGLFGLAVCFAVVLGITSGFPDMGGFPLTPSAGFLGLMFVWAVACVSPEVVMGLIWRGTWPAEKLENPWRGLALTAMMFILGTLALWWTRQFVGGGDITPILHHYLIMTVVITLFLVVAFQAWPFAGRFSVPTAGFMVLAATYLILLAIYRLWDWGAFADSPWAGIAPRGPFNPDSAVTFGVMTAFFLFVFVMLDMWPLTKFPSLMKQPILGLTIVALCILMSYISWNIMHRAMDMAHYEVLIKLPIVGLFGIFIVLPMFQTWPGRKWAQPTKGVVNLIFAAVLAIVMFFAVRALGSMFTGVPFTGAEAAYPVNYLWMATFMLGLVFPAMFVYGPFFDFWPLPPTPPPPGPPEAQESGQA